MPQAMPLNWLELFIFMSMIFLILNIKLYYHHYSTPKIYYFKKIKKNNWKW